jgi:uncharacterized protein involved in exopolysaccharide biosynthesis
LSAGCNELRAAWRVLKRDWVWVLALVVSAGVGTGVFSCSAPW